MALKPKQRLLAELMVSNPKMTNLQYAEEVDIDPKTVYKWKKEQEFQDYLHELYIEKFRSLEDLAITKLQENIEKNHQKAIEYALDYLGYKATQKVEAEVNTDINITID